MPELQEEALRFFVGLRAHRASWRGVLLLGIGLGEAGRALALASLAAGAAGLYLEEDVPTLRAAQREGCVSFAVTSLAEAIRILKNDVRRGRTVNVALRSAPEDALAEMLRRGLQPDALVFDRAGTTTEVSLASGLLERGALMLDVLDGTIGHNAIPLRREADAMLGSEWGVASDTMSTLQMRRLRDAELLAAAEARDADDTSVAALAAEWLRIVPSLQSRALTRFYLQRLNR